MHDIDIRSSAVALLGSNKLSAVARKRRMAKRKVEKRVSHGIALVGGLYILASVFAPSRVPVADSPVKPVAALPTTLQWHAAGEVLDRQSDADSLKALRPWTLHNAQSSSAATLTRWHSIFKYATHYAITADLAAKIYDGAIGQSIEPELAFRLVKVESEFKTRAASPVGAVGLTQLMPATARDFEPNVTREDLMDPETNLRIGFKYLRALIREHKGNLSLALLVYNRGPLAVQTALSLGQDPTNGYERVVTRGYRGRGTLD